MKEKDINVEFRYVGIPIDDCEIPGICFCYPDKGAAEEAFKIIHEYLLDQDSKSLTLKLFKNDKGNYDLHMNIVTAKQDMKTTISGIDPSFIEKLKEGLRKVTYYVILTGFTEGGDFQLLTPKKFHMFKQDILIDGEKIIGTSECTLDWISIFE